MHASRLVMMSCFICHVHHHYILAEQATLTCLHFHSVMASEYWMAAHSSSPRFAASMHEISSNVAQMLS
jgi:hypothetical protein